MALSREAFLAKMKAGREKKAQAIREAGGKVAAAEPNKGNGHKEPVQANGPTEPKRPPSPIIIPSMMQNAFQHSQSTPAVKYIAEPADDEFSLGLLGDIDNTGGQGRMVAVARSYFETMCATHKSTKWLEFSKRVGTKEPGIDGKRVQQLVQAIIGGDPGKMGNNRGNFSDRMKKWAQGKPKKDQENDEGNY